MPNRKADQILIGDEKARDSRLLDALRAWNRLSQKAKISRTREIVETREEELRRAYPDVLSVAYGFRTKWIKKWRTVITEPCVSFMVPHKWSRPPRTARDQERALPEFLYTYCEVRGRWRLVAVPTDVESATSYRVKPHRASVAMRSPDQNLSQPYRGVVTCAVNIPGYKSPYALSCHHVLAMSIAPGQNGRPDEQSVAHLHVEGDSGGKIGKLSRKRGRLVSPGPDNRHSLDIALAPAISATARENLTKALGKLDLKRWLHRKDTLPYRAKVHTPRGKMKLKWVQTWKSFDRIEYLEAGDQPKQATIVEYEVLSKDDTTRPGDSGSPITFPDDRLLGLYIAGDEDRKQAFMLPAYYAFYGPNYGMSKDPVLIR